MAGRQGFLSGRDGDRCRDLGPSVPRLYGSLASLFLRLQLSVADGCGPLWPLGGHRDPYPDSAHPESPAEYGGFPPRVDAPNDPYPGSVRQGLPVGFRGFLQRQRGQQDPGLGLVGRERRRSYLGCTRRRGAPQRLLDDSMNSSPLTSTVILGVRRACSGREGGQFMHGF